MKRYTKNPKCPYCDHPIWLPAKEGTVKCSKCRNYFYLFVETVYATTPEQPIEMDK